MFEVTEVLFLTILKPKVAACNQDRTPRRPWVCAGKNGKPSGGVTDIRRSTGGYLL